MSALGKQFAIFQEKMDEQKENSQKSAKEVIEITKNEISRLVEQNKAQLGTGNSHISKQLLKAQIKFNERKQEIKARISASHNRNENRRIKKETEGTAEFAEFAINHAILSIDEAILMFYEAIEKLESYEKNLTQEKENLTR